MAATTEAFLAAVAALAVLAAGVLAFPTLAAEPWEGTWTDHQGCQVPLLEMSSDVTQEAYGYYSQFSDLPLSDRVRGQVVGGHREGPFACLITKITTVNQLEAWIFNLSCGGEGDAWQSRGIVMRTPTTNAWSLTDGWREDSEAIATYNMTSMDAGGEIMQLYRCVRP